MQSLKDLRKRFGKTQSQFWQVLGVAQCTGSRYEVGREVPEPTAKLLQMVTADDEAAAVEMLRELRAAVRGV